MTPSTRRCTPVSVCFERPLAENNRLSLNGSCPWKWMTRQAETAYTLGGPHRSQRRVNLEAAWASTHGGPRGDRTPHQRLIMSPLCSLDYGADPCAHPAHRLPPGCLA